MSTPAQERARAKHLLDNFKLTPNEWSLIEAYQNGVCFICGRKNDSGKRLSTDHCHLSGEVRGLLCSRCNPLLGKLENAFIRYGLHKIPGITLVFVVKRLLEYVQTPPSRAALGRVHIGYVGRVGSKTHRKMLKKLAKKSSGT